MLSVWAFLSCLERFRVGKLIWLGGTVGLAFLLRSNIIILFIAMWIVLIVKLLCDSAKRRSALLIGDCHGSGDSPVPGSFGLCI